ncbi:unnamed protein product [Cyclocybe aegerita]|uniref:Glycoside hydrolase family 71 protein n=1 Tax=Cyclocybe aegerita TaxID=1973307 RepID=A0A8S0VXY2_CYCAE|nr:unnamed protein product [Cyclocybe aegerita]
MQLDALLFCFFTFFSVVNAAAIPFRRVKLPSNFRRSATTSDLLERRHHRFIAKREAVTLVPPGGTPTTTVTLVRGGVEPTTMEIVLGAPPAPTSTTSSTSNSPSTTPTPSSPSTTSAPSSSSASPSITSTSAPTPSQPPADNDGSRKYVVAHHMVGNTFPYTLEDWAEDISLAHAAGIDGFALNMGRDEWQPARVADAYEAAKRSGLDFKLFLSLDMSSFPCDSPDDAQTLRNLVNSHASHPNQLQYNSKTFVSTFAGENCNFGQGSAAEGWKTQFTKHPDLAGKIYFVPAFFIDPAAFKDFADVMDGDFSWNSGWPVEVTTPFAQTQLEQQSNKESSSRTILGVVTNAAGAVGDLERKLEAAMTGVLSKLQLALTKFIGTRDMDEEHLSGLAQLHSTLQKRDGEADKPAYMGAVSPWFFTHYGPDSFNKNFVFLSDQHLYSKRWESIINSRDQYDIVQVLTWNDYGESHYIGPIKGAQPNSEAWTDGMNHTAWLELTQYYATAFKTGQFPKIETDKIFMWSRPHSTKAQTSDPVPQPSNFELFEDAVWAVVMTTEPSTVTLATSDTTSKSFEVPAGVTKLAIPITPGGTMRGTIQRGGQVIVELNPKEFTFQGSPKTYNFNAFVASAAS